MLIRDFIVFFAKEIYCWTNSLTYIINRLTPASQLSLQFYIMHMCFISINWTTARP